MYPTKLRAHLSARQSIITCQAHHEQHHTVTPKDKNIQLQWGKHFDGGLTGAGPQQDFLCVLCVHMCECEKFEKREHMILT